MAGNLPPKQPADPRNREELEAWRKRRDEQLPGVPLSPREYLIVTGLHKRRPPYAER